MTTQALLTSLALGLTFATGGLFLSQQAFGEKGGSMEVASEKPTEPTKKIVKTDEEWKKELTAEQYRILRQSGTERAFGKVYEEFKKQEKGTYYCAGCDAELFTSLEKFDARCGWPAFYDASKHENVKTVRDVSGGMVRVEVRCAKCDGHLGHVFEGEGFDTPTDQRYCINGAVLKFVPAGAEKAAKDAKPTQNGEKE